MERYLTLEEIAKWPVGKRYKKTTYGGRKFFVKEMACNNSGNETCLEFFYRNGRWSISSEQRMFAKNLGIRNGEISKVIRRLNEKQSKVPKNIMQLNKSDYKLLYSDYDDADQLGYYDKNSPEYIRVNDILSNVSSSSRVYDVGCNSGGIGALLIKKLRCKVYGSELCPVLAKKARKKGLNVFCGWAEQTPYKDSSFDYLLITFILEHVLDPYVLMEECLRTLKPGGIILGHVPTEFGDWGKHTIGYHPEHLRAYNYSELENLFKKFNLRDISINKEKLAGRRISDYYFFKAKK